MSRLIDPNAPLDEAEVAALEARLPPARQPEPEPEFEPEQTAQAIRAASTDYDEELPF